MSELGKLVRRWQVGWGMALGVPPAEEARGGLHVLLGKPDRQVEVIAFDEAAVPDLAADVAAAPHPIWLTVPTTDPDAATRVVHEAGLRLLNVRECLMTRDLAGHPASTAPEDYRTITTIANSVIETRIERDSALAARGTMAVNGTDAVAHNISTTPEHRRRGLAKAVMSALVDEAVARGAKTGLLIASADGQHLYSALGWRRHATIVVAAK